MSLLGDTGVMILGITGREGRMTASHMLGYGTHVVAGVTPGKGGELVADVPVFHSVEEAMSTIGDTIGVSVVIVPPLATRDAVLDVLKHTSGDIVIATEGVPRHDSLEMLAAARDRRVDVVGPNSTGVIVPSKARKLGAIGGDRPQRAFVAGGIGVISRSGGMTSELALTIKQAGYGVSAAISVGGDEMIGLPPVEAAQRLQQLPETRAICYFGEPGTTHEERLAEAIADGRISIPVIALVAGSFTEHLPEGTAFGHAAAIIKSGVGRPSDKRRTLSEAGAVVVDSLDELSEAVCACMGSGAEHASTRD
jgi:succinyl-CoA synthetase alpha subunit